MLGLVAIILILGSVDGTVKCTLLRELSLFVLHRLWGLCGWKQKNWNKIELLDGKIFLQKVIMGRFFSEAGLVKSGIKFDQNFFVKWRMTT